MKTKSSIRTTALAMLMASAMMLGMPTLAAYNQPAGFPTGGNVATEYNATLNLVMQQIAAARSTGSYTTAINASLVAVNNFLAKHGNNQSDQRVLGIRLVKQYLDLAAALNNSQNQTPATGSVPMPNVQSLPVPPMAPTVPMMMPNIPVMPSMFETTDTFATPGCRSFTRRCMSCKGSGSCKICYGTGRVTGGYGGGRWDCTACNGTGRYTTCGN